MNIPELKNLFGVNYLPDIDLSLADISLKAQQMAGKLSISGVQTKLSMRLNKKKKELEATAENGGYILKPQINTFPDIPQNENLCMNIALGLGITVPPHGLLKLKDGSIAYIVKRFDRKNGEKLPQEDFCQILGRNDKYKGSIEDVGKKIFEISGVPGLDIQLFFERVLFFFIIGNGDAHLKNFSIIYDEQGQIRLSPAYDIVSSKLVIPEEQDFALPINGKKNKITGKDFEKLAEILKISSRVSYKNILGKIELINELIRQDFYMSDQAKKNLLDIVQERSGRF